MKWRLYYGDGSTFASPDCQPIASDLPYVPPPVCPCCGALPEAWRNPNDLAAYFAPVLNVQVLKQEADNERGYSQRHGSNFFVWETSPLKRWGGKGDVFGLADYYGYKTGPQKVLVGREIHDDTYQATSRQVVADGPFRDREE